MLKPDELIEGKYYSIINNEDGIEVIFIFSCIKNDLIYIKANFILIDGKCHELRFKKDYYYIAYNETIKEVFLCDFVSYLSASHPYKIKFRKERINMILCSK